MNNDITTKLPKGSITKERKAREHKSFRDNAAIALKAFIYTIYGTAVLVTAIVAAYAALNLIDLPLRKVQAILACIGIAAAPVAFVIGKMIINGLMRLARGEQ